MSRPPIKAMEAVRRYCKKKNRARVVLFMFYRRADIACVSRRPKIGRLRKKVKRNEID